MTFPILPDANQNFTEQMFANDIATSISEIQQQATRLGLAWRLRPGTVQDDGTTVIVDGDSSALSTISLVGKCPPGQRVMVLYVPPSSNYIVGFISQNFYTWTDFTPKIYTNTATTPTEVTGTVGYAKFLQIGKTVWAVASVTFGANTSGGASVDLPVLASTRLLNCGTCGLFGSSTPADQSGLAFMTSDRKKLVIVAYSTGFRDATSGHTIRYSVCYEAA
jgi:hypothetical protein